MLEIFKPSIRGLPRLSELLLDGLGQDAKVRLVLPSTGASAGRALLRSKYVITEVLAKGPAVFKIGLTGNPMFRFYKKPSKASPSPGYLYEKDKYEQMFVLFAGATFDEAALMEAALIADFKDKPGSRNINPGGEGRQVYDPPYFTYLAFKTLYHHQRSK